MAVNDVWEVKLYCHARDQMGLNVLHYAVSAQDGDGASSSQIAFAMEAALAPLLKACVSLEAEFRGCTAQRISPIPAGPVAESINERGFCDGTGDLLPRVVSGLIGFKTALGGRANRGRMFVPFPSEAFNTDEGEPTSAYVDLLLDLGAGVATTRVVGSLPDRSTLSLVIWHRLSITFTPVEAAIPRTRWASQYRRGDYGRTNSPAL